MEAWKGSLGGVFILILVAWAAIRALAARVRLYAKGRNRLGLKERLWPPNIYAQTNLLMAIIYTFNKRRTERMLSSLLLVEA
ncbi:hypothetical protein F5Y01DRAFT_274716 [Xylaria sp. FL0043]|nr:hypothetical protein F5Y01DRAFT_274716 [Xylaria sp. FL0043]